MKPEFRLSTEIFLSEASMLPTVLIKLKKPKARAESSLKTQFMLLSRMLWSQGLDGSKVYLVDVEILKEKIEISSDKDPIKTVFYILKTRRNSPSNCSRDPYLILLSESHDLPSQTGWKPKQKAYLGFVPSPESTFYIK